MNLKIILNLVNPCFSTFFLIYIRLDIQSVKMNKDLLSTGDGGGGGSELDMVMESDAIPVSGTSWKEKLFGKKVTKPTNLDILGSKDLVFSEDDILKSTINGIPVIDFLECIQKLLVKGMETTVVVKLLGRNIGYTALHN